MLTYKIGFSNQGDSWRDSGDDCPQSSWPNWNLNSAFRFFIVLSWSRSPWSSSSFTLIIFMSITRIITMIIFRFLRALSGAKTIYNLTTTVLLVVFINVPFPIYDWSFEKVFLGCFVGKLDIYCCLFLCCCRIETYLKSYFRRINKT